jgi:hypothetical protein
MGILLIEIYSGLNVFKKMRKREKYNNIFSFIK